MTGMIFRGNTRNSSMRRTQPIIGAVCARSTVGDAARSRHGMSAVLRNAATRSLGWLGDRRFEGRLDRLLVLVLRGHEADEARHEHDPDTIAVLPVDHGLI